MNHKIFFLILLAVSSISISAVYAVTTNLSPGNDVSVDQGKKIFLDTSTNTYITNPTTNGRLDIVSNGVTVLQLKDNFIAPTVDYDLSAGQRLYLDGGVNTYIYNSAGQIIFYSNGSRALVIGNDQSLQLQQGKKFYVDGGSDTYVTETVPHTMDFYSNNVKKLSIGSDVCIGSC
jgi:hypothetical protein